MKKIIISSVLFAFPNLSLADLSWIFGKSTETKTIDLKADPYDYGVDITYPVHHYIQKDGFFKERYQKLMDGCYKKYSKHECDSTEAGRLEMSKHQPANNFNYTEIGFKKMKLPEELYQKIKAFWDENKANAVQEVWHRANTVTNNWETPSYMVSFENKAYKGGWDLKNQIWDGVKPILSEWIGGKELEPTSLYGIRKYSRGAVLAPHADRLPLVTSCIIQVDQNVDEPWPLEIYSHDGKAYNITLEPGEMALYESHTTIHGRPAPLNGEFFANIFVHFQPVEYDEVLDKMAIAKDAAYRHMNVPAAKVDTGRTGLHNAAANGHVKQVEDILNNLKDVDIHKRDENGWQAIHEAVRNGNIDIVKMLTSFGADLTAKTNNGGTVMWWAKHSHPDDHEVVRFLEENSAPDYQSEF